MFLNWGRGGADKSVARLGAAVHSAATTRRRRIESLTYEVEHFNND